jgi:Beta-lactamase enzyme family
VDRRRLSIAPLVSIACLLGTVTAGEAKAPDAHKPRWHPHVAEAKRFAKRRAGEVGFAVVDPHGRIAGFRVAMTAPTASVIKVMLMVAYLRKHDERRLTDYDRALLAPMIRSSDNIAATIVRDLVGRRRVERVARVSGMRDFEYHPVWGLSRTSARDQARFMFRLDSYIPEEHRAYARYLLSHIVRWQRWGLARVAPEGWALFFKGGWGSGTGLVDHQVALLTRRRHKVGVAILTQGDPDHGYGKKTLRGVAARLLGGLERPRR